jgi:hypothetical protein
MARRMNTIASGEDLAGEQRADRGNTDHGERPQRPAGRHGANRRWQ